MESVIQLHRQNTAYKDIFDYLTTDILSEDNERRCSVFIDSPFYILSDYALYRAHVKEGKCTKAEGTLFQFVIQNKLIPTILTNSHDSPVSGGLMGFSQILEKIRDKYYFPKITSVIIKYVKSCEICCQRKKHVKATNATIIPMPVLETPWVHISRYSWSFAKMSQYQ